MVKRITTEIKMFKIFFRAEFDYGMTGGWGFDAPEEVLYQGIFTSNADVRAKFEEIAESDYVKAHPHRTLDEKVFWEFESEKTIETETQEMLALKKNNLLTL